MGSPHGRPIVFGDAELGIEQGAVDVDGQQADGSGHQEILAVDRASSADSPPGHSRDQPKGRGSEQKRENHAKTSGDATPIGDAARRIHAIVRKRMGSLLFFAFSWWGIILQAIAIIHFIRRRPDTFWLFVILIGGCPGRPTTSRSKSSLDAETPVLQGLPSPQSDPRAGIGHSRQPFGGKLRRAGGFISRGRE